MRPLPRPTTPEALVIGYVVTLEALRTQVLADFGLVGGLRELIDGVVHGEITAHGRSRSGIEYIVDANGCCLTDLNGVQIDVDVHPDGRCLFDTRRLVIFAHSLGQDLVALGLENEPTLLAACRRLVERSLLTRVEWRPGAAAATTA